ncbi:hypothetical protein BKA61DRAFT_739686 [Leptodontidium sp. MPI-SDFR-AT-0119]|nr:hypothetical protein BKA61DRAFT_739686 [Leptodontidium sp. MPI-SDFR-AT-0119]
MRPPTASPPPSPPFSISLSIDHTPNKYEKTRILSTQNHRSNDPVQNFMSFRSTSFEVCRRTIFTKSDLSAYTKHPLPTFAVPRTAFSTALILLIQSADLQICVNFFSNHFAVLKTDLPQIPQLLYISATSSSRAPIKHRSMRSCILHAQGEACPAGTGKTTVTRKLLHLQLALEKSVLVMASPNLAVNNIAGRAQALEEEIVKQCDKTNVEAVAKKLVDKKGGANGYNLDWSLANAALKLASIADQGPSKSSKCKCKKSKDDNDFDESKSDSDDESEADQTVTIDVHTGEVLTTQSTDQESINPAPSDSPASGEQLTAIKEPINPTPLTHSASNKQPTITDEDTDPSQSTPSPSPPTAISDLPDSVDQGPSPDEAPPPRPSKFSEDIIARRKEQRHGQEPPTQGQGLQFPPHLSPSVEQRPGLPRRLILSSASSEHDPVSPSNDLHTLQLTAAV